MFTFPFRSLFRCLSLPLSLVSFFGPILETSLLRFTKDIVTILQRARSSSSIVAPLMVSLLSLTTASYNRTPSHLEWQALSLTQEQEKLCQYVPFTLLFCSPKGKLIARTQWLRVTFFIQRHRTKHKCITTGLHALFSFKATKKPLSASSGRTTMRRGKMHLEIYFASTKKPFQEAPRAPSIS